MRVCVSYLSSISHRITPAEGFTGGAGGNWPLITEAGLSAALV